MMVSCRVLLGDMPHLRFEMKFTSDLMGNFVAQARARWTELTCRVCLTFMFANP